MNFLIQIVNFEKLSEGLNMTANARSLYYALLAKNNDLAWIEEFKVPNSILQEKAKLNHRKQLDDARNRLVDLGFIEYKKGKPGKAGTYKIVNIQDDIQVDIQVDIQPNIQPSIQHHIQPNIQPYIQPSSTLNKLNKIKLNKTKLNNIYKKNITKKADAEIKESESSVSDDPSISFVNDCKNIIEYLNNKLNTNYKYNSSINKKAIIARLNEGYNLEDFKKVIDKKYEEWKDDPKMSKYLRPSTLFSNKFESYLNQLEVKQSKQKQMKDTGNNYTEREADEYLSLIK